MLKRLAPLAALLVALAATVPTPPAHAADRTYTLCDPMVAKLCGSLVALYEFEEPSNSARTSETGSAPFLEPSNQNLARVDNGSLTTGTYALDPDPSSPRRVYIPRSASLAGEFTLTLWIYVSNDSAEDSNILFTTDAIGTVVGSKLLMIGASGTRYPRFSVKQMMTDTTTTVTSGTALGTGAWKHVAFGEYPTPTDAEPNQITLWISVNAEARTTATAAYPPQVFIGDFNLGDSPMYGDYRFDQLAVFGGTLSAGELTWLYNGGSGRPFPFTSNP